MTVFLRALYSDTYQRDIFNTFLVQHIRCS